MSTIAAESQVRAIYTHLHACTFIRIYIRTRCWIYIYFILSRLKCFTLYTCSLYIYNKTQYFSSIAISPAHPAGCVEKALCYIPLSLYIYPCGDEWTRRINDWTRCLLSNVKVPLICTAGSFVTRSFVRNIRDAYIILASYKFWPKLSIAG